MKLKNLHCVKKKQTNKMKNKSISLSPIQKALHFPSFCLLCNAIIHVEYIKAVHLKRKLNHITTGRELCTTLKKIDKIRIKSKYLMLRKTKQEQKV